MREVTDEALQRLYWACRSRSGFPGNPLDESNGPPSTTAIIDALGLMRPSLEDPGGVENGRTGVNSHGNSSVRPPQDATSPASATSPTQDEYLPSPTQSSFSMASMRSPESGAIITATTTTNNRISTIPATPPEMDMSEQFLYAASEHLSSRSNSTSGAPIMTHMENSSSMNFDLDAYLDTSACTIPPNLPQLIHNMHDPGQYDMLAMMERPTGVYPRHRSSLPALPLIDRYLSPWPGSLAETYNTNTGGRNVSMAI
ncbi:hypothetical protein LTR84_004489 [Exophiala bonariae]|uniref:Uncharacterized protein n=1 Tax=Exophiala bonariae TaxID=1690606 RepID=A0AAV9N4Q7_9EURO|nr:hypothetical protein LTR84_004489 [Exophiala bonariae]